jgi:hypothetical protein
MGLPLKYTRACAEMAKILASFMPGSGAKVWKGHVSFRSIAEDVGLGQFWSPGTKEPAVATLLERTLEHRPELFERLILSIIRAGMKNLQKSGGSITADQIRTLNGLILEVGYKFAELRDPAFLRSLETPGSARAAQALEREQESDKSKAGQHWEQAKRFDELRVSFYELCSLSDRQKAGLELEKVLNGLFELAGLKPREPFRITGEQIDGAVELDHEVYLVEAKWEAGKLGAAPLYEFREKVTGKSPFTRGVFVALNGCTNEAQTAIVARKAPHFFVVDGYDLVTVLEGRISLITMLRNKQRKLSEEGNMFVSVKDMV